MLPDPSSPFGPKANGTRRRVAVIGKGDSGKTILEYLTKKGPVAGYEGAVDRVALWVGIPWRTRDDYDRDRQVRRRYKDTLVSNFPTKAGDGGPDNCPLIRPFRQKLVDIDCGGGDDAAAVTLTLDGGATEEVDIAILATSLKPTYAGLYGNLLGFAYNDDPQRRKFEGQYTERVARAEWDAAAPTRRSWSRRSCTR